MKKFLILVIISCFLISCGDDEPTKPDPSFLDGKWSAKYFSNFAIDDQVDTLFYDINITEYKGDISGTAEIYFVWYQTMMGGTIRTENRRNGMLIGKLEENEVSFYLEEDGKYPFTGSLNQDSTEINGNVIVTDANNNNKEISLSFSRK